MKFEADKIYKNTPEKYKDLCHETDKNGYETIHSDDEEDMGVSSQVVEELGKESRKEEPKQ